ncbi:MAG: PHP domain-containing protein [Methanomassiliicoccales archaeon]|nr:PHP domain-containing protein [Methanomassiliicoccales archaeon]
MTSCRLLFHVHTHHSADAVLSPETIVRYCSKNGIEIVAICDHDFLLPHRERIALEEKYGVRIIPAIEYSTENGDIIGLFIEEACESHRCDEVLLDIRKQTGIAVLPHPMRGHRLEKINMAMIDAIEVFNGRCDAHENSLAAEKNTIWKKIGLAGCDAHFPWELGIAVNIINLPDENDLDDDEALKKSILSSPCIEIEGRGMPRLNTSFSLLIKAIKKRSMKALKDSLPMVKKSKGTSDR